MKLFRFVYKAHCTTFFLLFKNKHLKLHCFCKNICIVHYTVILNPNNFYCLDSRLLNVVMYLAHIYLLQM